MTAVSNWASEEVLRKLSGLAKLDISFETLKGWQALDDYSDDEIIAALKALYPDPKKRHRVISEVLREIEKELKPSAKK